MKARWYAVPFVGILVCMVASLIVRGSYFDVTDSVGGIAFSLRGMGSFQQNDEWRQKMNQPIYDVDYAIVQAKLVVCAQFSGDRFVYQNGFYSHVTVKEVYRGDEKWLGEQICVMERMEISIPSPQYTTYIPSICPLEGPYLPLQKGDNYILLLAPYPYHEARVLTQEEQRRFYPVTCNAMSVFRLSAKRQTRVFEEYDNTVSSPPLSTFDGVDLCAATQEDLIRYYDAKDKVCQTFDIPLAK